MYWHRELPPLDADLVAENTVEANSSRVPATIAYRDELWDPKHDDAAGEACLHGRFSYMLYRRPQESR